MNGMHRISGSGTMPTNCGMQGMHGNTLSAQAQKEYKSADKLQNTQVAKIPDDAKGNTIDVKI